MNPIPLMLAAFYLLQASPPCSYPSGFQKGLEDLKTGSHGLNLDRFCASASEQMTADFQKGYQRSQAVGKEWEELKLSAIPQNEQETTSFLEKARTEARIKKLEEETKRLKKRINK